MLFFFDRQLLNGFFETSNFLCLLYDFSIFALYVWF